jgi:hypothetical protein
MNPVAEEGIELRYGEVDGNNAKMSLKFEVNGH